MHGLMDMCHGTIISIYAMVRSNRARRIKTKYHIRYPDSNTFMSILNPPSSGPISPFRTNAQPFLHLVYHCLPWDSTPTYGLSLTLDRLIVFYL
jgi:hypothetical protein